MSTKLSCDARKCVNNINGLCDAYMIHVTGVQARESSSTDCGTFAEKGILSTTTSRFTNSNLMGEFKQLFTNESIEMSPHIKCEAQNCIYNVNTICEAENVQVHGPEAQNSGSTQCETFKPHN